MAKGWLDNYGTKENENNSSVSLPEGFVGMGNNTKGRNYSPAWGGQFQMGGQAPKRRGVRYNEDGSVSTHLMKTETDGKGNWFSFPTLFQNSIPYADDSENWLDMSDRPWEEAYEEAKKRGEVINFGSDKDAAIKFGQGSWKDKKQMGGSVYPVNYVPEAQMGASIPGAVGFSYARVGAPSKGPRRNQTDVTDASAQNGQEMKYYQEGLDFKPKSISKNGGWLDGYDVAQAGTQVEYGTPEYEEAYNKGEVVTDEGGRSPILLDEVVVPSKPLTEFGKTRKEIAAKNKWEDYAQKYLGNFEKNMGQTLENLPESRKQEYEDYINKLAFDEYVKTHPQLKGEERGAYIDRMQAENANSSNFERAYEANADYNDATDVNKWRKGLIGLGSLVLPKPAMDYMKQESDYFSKKEKQAMIDNPISTQVGDVMGTLEPLTIPVESLYGNKSFGDIASGESADIPMSARILGDPLMLGFEAAPLIGSGFRTAGRLLGTEEGLLSNTWKVNPFANKTNLPEVGEIIKHPFRDQFVPIENISDKVDYFHLTAAPDNIPQVAARDSEFWNKLNNDSRFFIKRTDNTPSAIIDMPIMDFEGKFPIPMNDINKYRSAENIKGNPHWLQGYKPIEVPIATESVVSNSLQAQDMSGLHLQSTMDNGAISKIVEPKSGLINTEQALAIIGKESGGSDKVALIKQGLGETIPKKMDYNEFRKIVQDQLVPLERQFINHRSNYGLEEIGYTPLTQGATRFETFQNFMNTPLTELFKKPELLENQTLILGNKNKFGIGSSAHGNPEETLAHIHFLRTSENPDILTVTQMQSDAFQGTHAIMPNSSGITPELEKWKSYLKPEFKAEFIETQGLKEANAFEQRVKNSIQKLEEMQALALGPNPNQKLLLEKNHQERYIQELVDYAASRGDVNKIRLPTSNTAADIQGYSGRKQWNIDGLNNGDEVVLLDGSTGKVTDDTWNNTTEITTSDGKKINIDFSIGGYGESKTPPIKSVNNIELKEVSKYTSKSETILKKYKEQPKLIKKLFGEEPTIVTDGKGNTWYEFEIPKNFKEGKGQIKAFKEGGIIDSDRGQWDHPGEITRIKGGNITMKPDPKTGKALTEPLLGISNRGERKRMYPGQDYQFEEGTEYVTEYPMSQNGLRQEQKGLQNLDQLTNFTNYNKPQPGGWLNKYN